MRIGHEGRSRAKQRKMLCRANATDDRDKKPQELRPRNRDFLILREDDLSLLCFIGFPVCYVLSINPLFMQSLSESLFLETK